MRNDSFPFNFLFNILKDQVLFKNLECVVKFKDEFSFTFNLLLKCDYFLICTAANKPQLDAIVEEIEDEDEGED